MATEAPRTYTITTHRWDGVIERTLVWAASEEEARAKFEADSTEFIVSIHEVLHGVIKPADYRVGPIAMPD